MNDLYMEVLLDEANQRDVRISGESPLFGKEMALIGKNELGRCGEDLATWYLSRYGMEVVDRNWRCSLGEVDIVAHDDDEIVLVEVKTRRAQPFDSVVPEVAVNHRKRAKYQSLAMAYLGWQADTDNVRFDVVAIKLSCDCTAYIRHIRDAFEAGM